MFSQSKQVEQNDLKVFMSNDQVVNIELGNEMNNDEVMDEILSMSAAGNDYSVYRINAYYKWSIELIYRSIWPNLPSFNYLSNILKKS